MRLIVGEIGIRKDKEFMKIVKEGVTVQFDCKSCGCLFRAGIHSVKTPDNGENYYVECPMCGSECHADISARDSRHEFDLQQRGN